MAGLDFPAESFDAAVSRFGIILEPEAEANGWPGAGLPRPGFEDGDQFVGAA